MTLFHAVVAIVVTAVVSGALGYAFRGRESRAIAQVGQMAKTKISKL